MNRRIFAILFAVTMPFSISARAEMYAQPMKDCVNQILKSKGIDPSNIYKMQNLSNPQSFVSRALQKYTRICAGVEETSELTSVPRVQDSDDSTQSAG